MQPKNWIKVFLNHRNLSLPDGRPLYQYRVTNEEFASLEKVMQLSSSFGLSMISQKLPRWNAAFVLYASEWWRRKYDGSSWSWDKIFASFNADYHDLNTATRNLVVETGLRYWKRQVRVLNRQSRYLGSVTIEGGLPLNQLTGSGGWLDRVLKSATAKYIRLQNSGISASMIVSEYVDYLPKTYRTEAIYSILGEMVQNVAELKKAHLLEQMSNPVSWLDVHVPSWREKFPLPLDQDVGIALLSDMVKIAISTKESNGLPFRATRQLSTDYSLQLIIELLPFVFLEDAFPGQPTESIPAKMEVELVDHTGQYHSIGLAFKTNYQSKPALKFNKTSYRIKGDKAAYQYSLRFKTLGEIIAKIPLPGGEELDEEAPWIFTKQSDDWILEGMASVATRAAQVRILYPETFSCEKINETSEWNEIASVDLRKLIEASGQILFNDNAGNLFTVKTSEAGQDPVSYYLSGNTINYSSNPKELFRGIPKLFRFNNETGQSKEIQATQLSVRPLKTQRPLQSLLHATPGIYEIRLQDQHSHISFRKKIALLHEKFDIRLLPGAAPNEGKIQLYQSGSALVICDSSTVRHTIIATPSINGHCIELTSESTPPTLVSLTLSWPNMPEILSLSIPFPARGAQLIDPDGDYVKRKNLYQDSLHGFRLRLFNETPDKHRSIILDFNLVDNTVENPRDLYFSKTLKLTGSVVELALIDYLEWIQNLLAISNNLDAQVKITVRESGTELIRVNVLQYQMSLEKNDLEGSVYLSADDHAALSQDLMNQVQLKGMRMTQPEQKHIELEAKRSEITESGSWFFYPEKRQADPWLIYPGEESAVSFRPILWDVQSEYDEVSKEEMVSSFFYAVKISDPVIRQANLERLLDELCGDFEHKNWEYLKNLWRKCRHLPLTTFDVWKLAVKNTKVLAAFVLQMDEKFLVRLTSELPVLWELIPLSDWLQVMSQYKYYLKKHTEDDNDLSELLSMRLEKISQLSDSMDMVSRLLSSILLNRTDKELIFMQMHANERFLRDRINDAYQELCRCQADSQWPEMLNAEINAKCSLLNNSFQNIIPSVQLTHHESIIALPILLASFCLTAPPTEWIGESVHIFKLKQLKTFDEQWFNTAFKFVVAFQYQQSHVPGVTING